MLNLYLICTLVTTFLLGTSQAHAIEVPSFRFKVGVYNLNASAGQVLTNQPLNAMVTLQPTVLWDLASFRSRLGVHFLMDLNSPYGMTPTTGVGFSGYFYPFGLSNFSELDEDESLKQVSRPGPYVHGGITPVNFNMNQQDPSNQARNFSFSGFLVELLLAAGFDYPLQRNLILSLEGAYRSGSAPNTTGGVGGIQYSGFGVNLSIMTSYY